MPPVTFKYQFSLINLQPFYTNFISSYSFDSTLALEVEILTNKLLNENIETIDASYLKFESNQKRELLSQLYDKVIKILKS